MLWVGFVGGWYLTVQAPLPFRCFVGPLAAACHLHFTVTHSFVMMFLLYIFLLVSTSTAALDRQYRVRPIRRQAMPTTSETAESSESIVVAAFPEPSNTVPLGSDAAESATSAISSAAAVSATSAIISKAAASDTSVIASATSGLATSTIVSAAAGSATVSDVPVPTESLISYAGPNAKCAPFWMEQKKHQGVAPFNTKSSGNGTYQVFRNVQV